MVRARRAVRVGATLGALLVGALGLAVVEAAPAAADPSPAFVQLTGGAEGDICARTAAGAAWCWGEGSYGKLGNGGTADAPSPIQVATPPGVSWAAISAGRTHTCGLSTTGAAYCWGSDESGQLGNGPVSTADVLTPASVTTPPGVTWQRVSAGSSSTCALTTTNAMYCWGYDLGVGTTSHTPTLQPGGPWASVDVGGSSYDACAVTTSGAGYCWGHETAGNLGNGGGLTDDLATPTPVVTAPGVSWASIAPSFDHTCGLTTTGALYCWGNDEVGNLGNGAGGPAQAAPVPVTTPPGVVWSNVAVADAYNTCAVTTTGAAYCWGGWPRGRLGSTPQVDRDAPYPVETPAGVTWSSAIAAGESVCAISVAGPTYCWGDDEHGGVGNGSPGGPYKYTPTLVGADNVIAFPLFQNPYPAGVDVPLTATASSRLPITYSVTGPCTLTGNTLRGQGGTCAVTASQAGGSGWAVAAPVTRNFGAIVGFYVSDVSAVEGSNAFQPKVLTFTVQLTSAQSTTSSVKYATSNGTATAPADYTAKALTTLTFSAGQTSKVVSISLAEDTVDEPDETVLLNLSGAVGPAIVDSSAVGTIVDDDAPAVVPTVSVADVSVVEGTSLLGGKNMVFTVQLSAPAPATVSVQYATADGTAVQPADYTRKAPTVLSFSKGQTSKTVSVPVKGDSVNEVDEQFSLVLSNPIGVTITDGSAQGTILDDD